MILKLRNLCELANQGSGKLVALFATRPHCLLSTSPTGNAQAGEVKAIHVELTSDALPGPRLKPDAYGVVWVPAYTDLKLHGITSLSFIGARLHSSSCNYR
jgi:hypothetical protein